MFGTGMYPSQGYNQTPFGALLQSVSNAFGAYEQGTLFDTNNYSGTLAGTSSSNLLVIGGLIIIAILLLK